METANFSLQLYGVILWKEVYITCNKSWSVNFLLTLKYTVMKSNFFFTKNIPLQADFSTRNSIYVYTSQEELNHTKIKDNLPNFTELKYHRILSASYDVSTVNQGSSLFWVVHTLELGWRTTLWNIAGPSARTEELWRILYQQLNIPARNFHASSFFFPLHSLVRSSHMAPI